MPEDIDEHTWRERNRFIAETWKNLATSVISRDHQFMNWLFTLHAGGVAGGLGFAASKGAGLCLLCSVSIFAGSLILILIFGAKMFYNESGLFREFQGLANRYSSDQVEWQEIVDWNDKRPGIHRGPEILAWIAGIAVVPAVLLLIVAIA